MQIDIGDLSPAIQYKLLSSTVVPRPIALITTLSSNGQHNAAPFSYFNVMGENPPVLIVALESKRETDELKDTTVNILDNGQFVVHMVDEPMVEAMNVCAIDFPADVNEVEEAGLTLVPSQRVTPSRIEEAPVAFECEKIELVKVGPGRHLVLGKILTMHVRDGLLDLDNYYIDTDKYKPVGRMFGRYYVRLGDYFDLAVPSYEDWRSISPSE